MSEGQPVLGKFVWHDLVTSDIDKAIAFYTDLFGWTINEADMGPGGKYKMIHAAGTDHGGFMALDAAKGIPPHWISYCTVADVDAALARAGELGGKTHVPAMDIPGIGRFALIADPAGAMISPYKPNAWGGEGITAPWPPGTFCWHELLALDPQGEGKFHSEVFGWRIESMDMGPMGTYHLFKRDNGQDAGGMLLKPDGSGPSAWLPYVAVEDTRERTERVTQLGGQVFMQPTDIPNVGRFSVFADPTGAVTAMLGPST